MAKSKSRSRTTRTPPTAPAMTFSRINALYLGAGGASIALGFFLLAQGSMNVAPILLVLGYCVLLPIGIIKR